MPAYSVLLRECLSPHDGARRENDMAFYSRHRNRNAPNVLFLARHDDILIRVVVLPCARAI